METNENTIRIGKTANISVPLILGNDYEIRATVHCKNSKNIDNENGTIDVLFTLDLLGEVEILNDKGQVIKAKTKGSPSQRLRWMLMEMGYDYEQIMAKMISDKEELQEFLDKINKINN